MRIERIIAESASIVSPTTADRITKDEKQTHTSEAVSFDADRRQQGKQQETEEKQRNPKETLEGQAFPSDAAKTKHIDVIV